MASSVEAWLDVLQQLMPQGVAWSRENGGNQTRLLRALAKTFARVEASAEEIEAELLPSDTRMLMDERETYLGLAECVGASRIYEHRLNSIITKDKLKGGLATWQIEQLAADLGFTVRVEEIWPHHCLRSCADSLNEQHYRHVLKVTVLDMPLSRFSCVDNVSTPLIATDASTFECMLSRYKMGGKYYEFNYEEVI